MYTDEVKAKSRALEKTRMKLRSAEEDIADLQTEFELERQGYLDAIRNQVLTISHPITGVIYSLEAGFSCSVDIPFYLKV